MQEMLDRHQFHMDYSGEYKQHNLVTLGIYLQGKPDRKGWRDLFAENDAVPIPKNGRVFPHWALLDLYKLMATAPEIERQILYKGVSLSDLPSLTKQLMF